MDEAACPNVSKCELFPRFRTDSALAFCQDTYCHGEYERCARFQYAKQHEAKPPSDLLPNGRKLVVVG